MPTVSQFHTHNRLSDIKVPSSLSSRCCTGFLHLDHDSGVPKRVTGVAVSPPVASSQFVVVAVNWRRRPVHTYRAGTVNRLAMPTPYALCVCSERDRLCNSIAVRLSLQVSPGTRGSLYFSGGSNGPVFSVVRLSLRPCRSKIVATRSIPPLKQLQRLSLHICSAESGPSNSVAVNLLLLAAVFLDHCYNPATARLMLQLCCSKNWPTAIPLFATKVDVAIMLQRGTLLQLYRVDCCHGSEGSAAFIYCSDCVCNFVATRLCCSFCCRKNYNAILVSACGAALLLHGAATVQLP